MNDYVGNVGELRLDKDGFACQGGEQAVLSALVPLHVPEAPLTRLRPVQEADPHHLKWVSLSERERNDAGAGCRGCVPNLVL